MFDFFKNWFKTTINVEFFAGLESFKKTAGDIMRGLRSAKKEPGAERIYTAGEKEYLAWLERREKGIPLNKDLQKEVIKMRDELNLTRYKFPFE